MISTFFVRISSDCNLNCEYCYVFKHADQSSHYLPRCMSPDTISLVIDRLKEYLSKYKLNEMLIVFHGGEPLLIGYKNFSNILEQISNQLSNLVKLSFSVQTNGSLLTKQFTEVFEKYDVGVSVSIDGPEHYHDIYRKDKKGKGSWNNVMRGINEIKKYPKLFSGTITVINHKVPPRELFDFFKENEILVTDFLLPDANYECLPKDRDENPNVYINWLVSAFDLWFDSYQEITVRIFENILEVISGLDISTDVFGGGELSYITIETDGSYHTSDILKTTYEGASKIGLTLFESSIEDVFSSKEFIKYNTLLNESNLSELCQKCDELAYCKGGCLSHRYSNKNDFNNPSVYCDEMNLLIKHARKRLMDAIHQQ